MLIAVKKKNIVSFIAIFGTLSFLTMLTRGTVAVLAGPRAPVTQAAETPRDVTVPAANHGVS